MQWLSSVRSVTSEILEQRSTFQWADQGRISVHDRLGGRLSVHDSLGERVGYFPRNQEELKEMANARFLDEFIFCRDANIHRVESKEVRYQPVWKTKYS